MELIANEINTMQADTKNSYNQRFNVTRFTKNHWLMELQLYNFQFNTYKMCNNNNVNISLRKINNNKKNKKTQNIQYLLAMCLHPYFVFCHNLIRNKGNCSKI